jgi:hypothetical protein
MITAIGPSIGRCCYEVDAVAADAFRKQRDSELFLFPGKRPDKWMLDLVEANRRQLLNCGIPAASIEAAGVCTVCHQEAFFSHRGSGGITGRQINFMMIKGDSICKALLFNDDLKHIH